MQVVDENFIYSLFSEAYYDYEYPKYDWNQIGTTESVQCLRKSFLQRKIGTKMEGKKITLLSIGRFIHKPIQKKLEDHGYLTEVEKAYPIQNLELMTHTDALHDTHIIELKSITRFPTQILTHHYLQSNTYVNIHNRPIAYVPYIHKPSGIVKVFPHKPSTSDFNFVILRAVRLSHCLRHNIMPEAEPSWLCRYCEYITTCPKPRKTTPRRGGF